MGNCLARDDPPNTVPYDKRGVSINLTDIPVTLPQFECDDACPVCLDQLRLDEAILTTACCNRAFHHKCLEMGLSATRNLCPMCRSVLSVPDEFTTVTCKFDTPVSEKTRLAILELLPSKLELMRQARRD